MKHRSKTEVRTLPAKELRIAAVSSDGFSRTLSGTAIVFGVRSQPIANFREIIAPTALTKTLSSGDNVFLLNNHNSNQALGSLRAKNLTLTTDSKGLNFSCQVDTRISYIYDAALAVENGLTAGSSFGFRAVKDSWKKDDGLLIRTVEELELFEISVTPMPCYVQTSASVRSCPTELRSMLKRSMDDEDDDCDCDCPECLDGDCEDCSNPDCDDPNCEHGEESSRSLNLWKLNMQLAIAKRR